METTELKIEDLSIIANGYVSSLINKLLNRAFKKHNLNITTEQWTVLTSLNNNDFQTQQGLSEDTFKQKGSITRLIDTLVKNQLVERTSSPNDRRSNLIHITDLGKKIDNKAKEVVTDIYNKSIKGVTYTEILKVKSIMTIIINNLINEDNL
ncbi:MAG: MarR family transcriptional regulator [Bacteroidales bacterium]